MKRLLILLSAMFLFGISGAYAQVEETPDEGPADAPAAPTAVAKTAAPRPAPVKKSIDTIRGNAGKDLEIIEWKGDCTTPMKSMAITNKSANRTIKAAVEVLVNFMGRQSKKNVIIDNLNAGETRFIGCAGCIDNQTGKTCTSYKIIIAMYK